MMTITNSDPQHHPLKFWVSFIIRMSLFSVALLWLAAIWYWWEAWVLIGLWTL